MRRAVFALLGTTIGTSLLVGAKLGTPTPGGTDSVAIDPASGSGADGVPAPGTPGQTIAAPGQATAAPASSGGAKTAKPTASKTTAAPKTTTKPATTSGLRNGTFTGASASSQYGTIRVTITISGGKITAVSATYPTSPARTATINNDAIPKLKQETLAAQSAKIATVSGATYTSTSYKTSLQSALDKARA